MGAGLQIPALPKCDQILRTTSALSSLESIQRLSITTSSAMKATIELCLLCCKRRSSRAQKPPRSTLTLFDHHICSRPRCAAFKALLEYVLASNNASSGQRDDPICYPRESGCLPQRVLELHADALTPFCAELADNSIYLPAHRNAAGPCAASTVAPHVDRSSKPSESQITQILDNMRRAWV